MHFETTQNWGIKVCNLIMELPNLELKKKKNYFDRFVNDAPEKYANCDVKRLLTQKGVFLILTALQDIAPGSEIRYLQFQKLYFDPIPPRGGGLYCSWKNFRITLTF